jgi:hypothetical protein
MKLRVLATATHSDQFTSRRPTHEPTRSSTSHRREFCEGYKMIRPPPPPGCSCVLRHFPTLQNPTTTTNCTYLRLNLNCTAPQFFLATFWVFGTRCPYAFCPTLKLKTRVRMFFPDHPAVQRDLPTCMQEPCHDQRNPKPVRKRRIEWRPRRNPSHSRASWNQLVRRRGTRLAL